MEKLISLIKEHLPEHYWSKEVLDVISTCGKMEESYIEFIEPKRNDMGLTQWVTFDTISGKGKSRKIANFSFNWSNFWLLPGMTNLGLGLFEKEAVGATNLIVSILVILASLNKSFDRELSEEHAYVLCVAWNLRNVKTKIFDEKSVLNQVNTDLEQKGKITLSAVRFGELLEELQSIRCIKHLQSFDWKLIETVKIENV